MYILERFSEKGLKFLSRDKSPIFSESQYLGAKMFKPTYPHEIYRDINILDKYIDEIKKDLKPCKNCGTLCCSLCRRNEVIHTRVECGHNLHLRIRKNHSTWRKYIPYKPIQEQENRFLDDIRWSTNLELSGCYCPCNEVRNNSKKIHEDMRKYSQDILLKHLKLIKIININDKSSSYNKSKINKL